MAKYLITITSNPTFCGVDAGNVQFAHGQAVIEECTLLNWFREHDGYEVEPIAEETEDKPVKKTTRKLTE